MTHHDVALASVDVASQEQAAMQMRLQLLEVVERLPVPFITTVPLPIGSMVQSCIEAFHRARRAQIRLQGHKAATHPPNALGAASRSLDDEENVLRAELVLLRQRLRVREECEALVEELRLLTITKSTLSKQRMQAASAQWIQNRDGVDDADADDGDTPTAMSVADTMATQVDHFLSSQHTVQTRRDARRRRGHNTLAHAVEQARMGYQGVPLKARLTMPLAVTIEALHREEVMLAESRAQLEVLKELVTSRLASREERLARNQLWANSSTFANGEVSDQ